MKKAFLISLALLILIGCSTTMTKHKKYIRDGVFFSGLNQFAFLEEWGTADKQGTWYAEGGQQRIEIGWRGAQIGGRHGSLNDVWVYYKRNKILFFSNHQLVAHYDWDEYQKTDRERKELPPIMK